MILKMRHKNRKSNINAENQYLKVFFAFKKVKTKIENYTFGNC